MIAWLLLAVGAPASIAIHLEEVGELPLDEARALVAPLAPILEAHTKTPARFVDPADVRCDPNDRCVSELRAQTGAESMVLVRVFGGPRRAHLRLERVPDGRVQEVNVERDRSDLEPVLTQVAALLYAAGVAASPSAPPASPALASPGPPILPLVLLGAAGASVAVGVGFGLGSAGAGRDLAAGPLPASQHQALVDQQDGQALAANLCFALATGAAIGALLTWVLDP